MERDERQHAAYAIGQKMVIGHLLWIQYVEAADRSIDNGKRALEIWRQSLSEAEQWWRSELG